MNKVRYKYLETICKAVENGKEAVIVSSDYAAPTLDKFRIDHADRYVSVGIAEQDLIQVACGLALSGETAIAYGMAPFPCIRAVDQIKNAAALMDLPISIVSAGVGFAIPEFGATHYCAEDIAIIRTIPNIRIINLTDETMAVKAAEYAFITASPLYIRIDKYSDGVLYKNEDIDFEKGFSVVREGTDAAVIASGYYTIRMLDIAEKLAERGINLKVIDLYSLPFDKDSLFEDIKNNTHIFTVEEHVLAGGIGSVILEFANDTGLNAHITRIGIDFNGSYPSTFGNREHFMKQYGLDDEAVISKIVSGL